MADIFLSYARHSANAAKLVAETLRAAGYSVWFDESLPAHRAYSEVIEEQLESAAAVLVLWSSDGVRSHWVRSEANRARETGRLIQVRLDGTQLPMPFDQIQCADLSRWRGNLSAQPWQNILSSVTALADREPTSGGTFQSASRVGLSRRQMFIGGSVVAAVAVAAGGFTAWRGFGSNQPSPEAQGLSGRFNRSGPGYAPIRKTVYVDAISCLWRSLARPELPDKTYGLPNPRAKLSTRDNAGRRLSPGHACLVESWP